MASTNKRVVVLLEYDGGRVAATGTISFSGPRPDIRVLGAKAELISGVKYTTARFDSAQELVVQLTAYHAQTLDGAVRVMRNVANALNLKIIGKIRVDDQTEKPERRGKKNKKK